MSRKQKRCTTFGVRLDDATAQKLQHLAEETDRTMGSVVRVLINLADVRHIHDVRLLTTDVEQIGE